MASSDTFDSIENDPILSENNLVEPLENLETLLHQDDPNTPDINPELNELDKPEEEKIAKIFSDNDLLEKDVDSNKPSGSEFSLNDSDQNCKICK